MHPSTSIAVTCLVFLVLRNERLLQLARLGVGVHLPDVQRHLRPRPSPRHPADFFFSFFFFFPGSRPRARGHGRVRARVVVVVFVDRVDFILIIL